MRDTVITLEGICRYFKLGGELIRALDDIDLTIFRNEYIALMGASGSGKSTLMNLIGCLDTPTSGKFIFEGEDVRRLSDNELAHIRNIRIGFVFQTFNLVPRLTTLENVALPLIYTGMGRQRRISRAMEVLESVGLTDRVKHRPNELSGGQRQRVALARALVNRPSLILADEPTGNLDTRTSHEIMELFQEIHDKGNTLVVVTHERDIAAYAHRIITLRDGQVESDRANEKVLRIDNA